MAFCYKVNGVKYKRYQEFCTGFGKKRNSPSIADTFPVEYLIENPEKGIMYIPFDLINSCQPIIRQRLLEEGVETYAKFNGDYSKEGKAKMDVVQEDKTLEFVGKKYNWLQKDDCFMAKYDSIDYSLATNLYHEPVFLENE